MPPVSTSSKNRAWVLMRVDTRSRVTPAVGSTMAMRRPDSQLNSDDLPTLGRPTMATCGTATARSSTRSARVRPGGRTRLFYRTAGRGGRCRRRGLAAAGRRTAGAARRDLRQQPAAPQEEVLRQRLIVLVLDVADDLLEDVFERDQPQDLVVLVADDGHRPVRLAEQVQGLAEVLLRLQEQRLVEGVVQDHDAVQAEEEE